MFGYGMISTIYSLVVSESTTERFAGVLITFLISLGFITCCSLSCYSVARDQKLRRAWNFSVENLELGSSFGRIVGSVQNYYGRNGGLLENSSTSLGNEETIISLRNSMIWYNRSKWVGTYAEIIGGVVILISEDYTKIGASLALSGLGLEKFSEWRVKKLEFLESEQRDRRFV